MAEIFLAKAAGPGGFEKTLVVKRILPQFAARKSFLDMFLAEARMAAQLVHPNIVQIFDFGEGDDGYFIAMEYIDGLNLRTLIKWLASLGERLSPEIAAKVISLACDGLAYAHDFVNPETGAPQGLIHRDVAADNIMLARTGAVKILDFGVARAESGDRHTRAGTLKGKVSYMSLEQISGAEIDRRVDIYALGVVLYFLLSGHKPFERPTEVALIAAMLTEPATPVQAWRDDLPVDLLRIIERATARLPQDRYSSCGEMQLALEQFLSTRPTPVTSGTLASLVRRAAEAGQVGEGAASRSGGSGSGSKGSKSGSHSGIRTASSQVAAVAREEQTDAGIEVDEDFDEVPNETPPVPPPSGTAEQAPPPAPQARGASGSFKALTPAAPGGGEAAAAPVAPPADKTSSGKFKSQPASGAGATGTSGSFKPVGAPAASPSVPGTSGSFKALVPNASPPSPSARSANLGAAVPPSATGRSGTFKALVPNASPPSPSSRSGLVGAGATGTSGSFKALVPNASPPSPSARSGVVGAGATGTSGNFKAVPPAASPPSPSARSGVVGPGATGTSGSFKALVPTASPPSPSARSAALDGLAGAPPPASAPGASGTSGSFKPVPSASGRSGSFAPVPPPAVAPAATPAVGSSTGKFRVASPSADSSPSGKARALANPAEPSASGSFKGPSSGRTGTFQTVKLVIEPGQIFLHTAHRAAPAALTTALLNTAMEDRSLHLLRKFPKYAEKLLMEAPSMAPVASVHLDGFIDAMLLAEEHHTLAGLLERASLRGSRAGPVGERLRTQVVAPLRLAALAERLSSGAQPERAASLEWMASLDAPALGPLLALVESLEPGPGQNLLCRALGPLANKHPDELLRRLPEARGPALAALSCVLEATQLPDRAKAFARVLAARDPQVTMMVLSGRARAETADSVALLEQSLTDKAEAVRLEALKLLGTSRDPRALTMLLARATPAALESCEAPEREGVWQALLATRSPEAFKLAEDTLAQKTTLLARKKSLAQKVPLVRALARSSLEEARGVLERVLAQRTQPEEVLNLAQEALAPKTAAPVAERLTLEQRAHMRRAVCLDLLFLIRAVGAIDITSGLLDPALNRLREELRALTLQDGKFELALNGSRLTLNGSAVAVQLGGTDLSGDLAQQLVAVDLATFGLEGAVPVTEVRALLTQLFDPDGAGQSAPHIKVSTWSGRPFRPARTPRPDLAARATELSQWVHDYLVRQHAALFSGRQMSMSEADEALDEWAACYAAEGPRCLAVVPDPQAPDAFAVHATNVATIGMCFAADLGLDVRTLREIAELSVMAALMETTLQPGERLQPGAGLAPVGCQRLATLALSQLRHRRAPAYAVMAYELAREYGGESSRGVGVVPTVVALAEAWAQLAFNSRLGHVEGVRLLNTLFVRRFSPEFLGLFANWVKAQFTM